MSGACLQLRLPYRLLHCEVDEASGEFVSPSKGRKSSRSADTHILEGFEDLGPFDLILFARFLHRPLHNWVRSMLKPGGYILYNSFLNMPGVQKFGRPSGPENLLGVGELANQFGRDGFEIISDEFEIESLDGREMSLFVARKI